jgi:hypothetical protein
MSHATMVPRIWWCASLLVVAIGSRDVLGQGLRWSTTFESQNAPTDQVRALHAFDDGSGTALYVGGDFHYAGPGWAVNHIARWDGTSWSRLGSGLGDDPGLWGEVDTLATYGTPAGAVLIVGGHFVSAGNVPAYGLAQWNGTSWSGVGNPQFGSDGLVGSLAVDGSRLYIGGEFLVSVGGSVLRNIAMWNGTSWSSLGGIGVGDVYPYVRALALFDDGNGLALYASGRFTNAGGVAVTNFAKWDGVTWSPVGVPPFRGSVNSMTEFDDGSGPALYVAGYFQSAGGVPALNIAKWDGVHWAPVGTGHQDNILTLTKFDDGNGPALYASGNGWLKPEKWDGSSWSVLGAGVGGTNGSYVLAMCSIDWPSSGRELFVGGHFFTAGTLTSFRVAGWDAFTGPVSTFCFGDGTVAACPCGNRGARDHGCENSLGLGGAHLEATGTPNPDTIVLHTAEEVSGALSIVLQGDGLILPTILFGDGMRCEGGHLKRLYTRTAVNGRIHVPGAGDPSITARSAALGDPIAPGSERFYQVLYRDPNSSFCPPPQGGSFNATNGLRVVW